MTGVDVDDWEARRASLGGRLVVVVVEDREKRESEVGSSGWEHMLC